MQMQINLDMKAADMACSQTVGGVLQIIARKVKAGRTAGTVYAPSGERLISVGWKIGN